MSHTVDLLLEEGIALVRIDNPPVNVFSQPVRQALLKAICTVESRDDIRATVIFGSRTSFVSGADLREFDTGLRTPLPVALFDRIERLEKPVVAALEGIALGVGLELALACHYRVATPEAQLGMPEVTLGVVPGAGGTQRLPRLVGVKHSLRMMLSGKALSALEARSMGLVDEILPGELRSAAAAFARRLVHQRVRPRRTRDLRVADTAEASFQSAADDATKTLKGRTTPALIVEAVRAAVSCTFEEGLRREARLSAGSLKQVESRALRHLFFAERQTSKNAGMSDTVSPRPIERIGIVGSGTMGVGIAMCFVDRGIPVTLLDVSAAALTSGLNRLEASYRASVMRGRLRQEDLVAHLRLLHGTTDFQDFREADLIIEAVIENMSVKKEVFRRLDTLARAGAILATNTSTLDINEIASVTGRARDVIGLHFFSPANVMRLVEIVRGDATAPDVVTTAFALARRIHKIGVLSGVCYGFIGNRMMDPYAREAERAVLEGATPAQVDNALEQFGMAMGILTVFDMAGVDVGVLTRKERGASLTLDPTYYRCSALLYERGWLGQKNGRGFYVYEGRERKPNPEAEALFRQEARRLGVEQRVPSAAEIQQRCFYAMINEGAKILEEGIAQRPADIDVVYTAGYGFPRHRGGPMFWADCVGADTVLKGIEEFAARFGSLHWQPARLLTDLARSGKGFQEWKP